MPNAATTNLYAESSAVLAWLLGEPREHDARQPFPREPIRALDAIHLASTLTARSAVRHMVLLSLDDRIRAAARIMGLDVVPA